MYCLVSIILVKLTKERVSANGRLGRPCRRLTPLRLSKTKLWGGRVISGKGGISKQRTPCAIISRELQEWGLQSIATKAADLRAERKGLSGVDDVKSKKRRARCFVQLAQGSVWVATVLAMGCRYFQSGKNSERIVISPSTAMRNNMCLDGPGRRLVDVGQVIHVVAHCHEEIKEQFAANLHFHLHGAATLKRLPASNNQS